MTNEDAEAKEIEAAKMKYRGQCDKIKGHSDGVGAFCFFAGLVVGAYAIFMAAVLWDQSWRDDLVRRGYAQHNQTTGAWEWRR
jgi:hypothetical protein